MRHRLLVVLLAAGALGGYASGFASLSRHHRAPCHSGSWGGTAYRHGTPPYWDWRAQQAPAASAGPSEAPGAR
ncbi:hypothetical protein D7Y13_40270 [Corallococcus praedator]|uniref:Lipoprotein n=1 Tax=Corallococcus praedator TaxID=2316724 RepID=A0ABX9Q7N5_9BACT|nr:hypothetical protein D7X75_40435 [Corallococcus sp. CA031C]RKH20369.1 hypothetical protein D7X74_04455 [Corallococcus sp. CA047B]RKH89926.1 hypothetical protein D7Y13_40270 [Corallococcus praedator]